MLLEIFALPYLAGKLLDKGIDMGLEKGIERVSEFKRIRGIYREINTFDLAFNDTALDSFVFEKYLNEVETQESLFKQIFILSKNKPSKEAFLIHLTTEATIYINREYEAARRPCFDNKQLLKEYFSKIYDHLLIQRDNLFTSSEQSQLTIIQEFVSEAKEEILAAITRLDQENSNNSSYIMNDFESHFINLKSAYENSIDTVNFHVIINKLDRIIERNFNNTEAGWKPSMTNIYKVFYISCLELENEHINLGVASYFYLRLKQMLLFLEANKEKLSQKELEGNFSLILSIINEDAWKVLMYLIIYLDEKEIIEFLHSSDLINQAAVMAPPLDITKERSFWGYVVSNAGSLDPFLLTKDINEVEQSE